MFFDRLDNRVAALKDDPSHKHAFRREMERFLGKTDLRESVTSPDFWPLLILTLREKSARKTWDAVLPFLTANEKMWEFFEPQFRQRLSELDETATITDRVRYE